MGRNIECSLQASIKNKFNVSLSITKLTLLSAASEGEVAEGFIKFNGMLGHTFKPQADTFQMPVAYKGISLTSKRFIQWQLK